MKELYLNNFTLLFHGIYQIKIFHASCMNFHLCGCGLIPIDVVIRAAHAWYTENKYFSIPKANI